jgi:hypothetical protein
MPSKFRLLHDNARCHFAKRVTRYLETKNVGVVRIPPYSPDLNPAEGLINEVKMRVGEMGPLTDAALVRSTHEAWAAVPQAVINRHMLRLQKVIEENCA